jgi:ribonuclease VapC
LIAVDTSALMAILLDEREAEACIQALATSQQSLISTGTVAEALIVAERRNAGLQMTQLIDEIGFTFIDVTPAVARRVARAYNRWGKGLHPAGLNFGDCFAYDTAKEHECPLLYVGGDFARTDVLRALQG